MGGAFLLRKIFSKVGWEQWCSLHHALVSTPRHVLNGMNSKILSKVAHYLLLNQGVSRLDVVYGNVNEGTRNDMHSLIANTTLFPLQWEQTSIPLVSWLGRWKRHQIIIINCFTFSPQENVQESPRVVAMSTSTTKHLLLSVNAFTLHKGSPTEIVGASATATCIVLSRRVKFYWTCSHSHFILRKGMTMKCVPDSLIKCTESPLCTQDQGILILWFILFMFLNTNT